jgi:hypothetical protein
MKKLLLILLCLPFIGFGQNPYIVETKNNKSEIKEKLSEEEAFIINHFPFKHITEWENGMGFMVGQKTKYKTDINLYPYKSKQSYSNKLNYLDFEFKIFYVTTVEEKIVNCPRGKCTRTYVVFECEGKKYKSYEMTGSVEELRSKKKALFSTISSLVNIDEIDKAKELLVDTHLYIMNNLWIEDADNDLGYTQFKGKKFLKVKITQIGLGNSLNPVKIIFKVPDGNEYSRKVSFSGINSQKEFLSKFSDIFSFSNPKDKYPEINNEIWSIIQEGKVRIGMTRLECELSWGNPKEINETIFDSEKNEQWVYSDNYLYFENGILKTIQD